MMKIMIKNIRLSILSLINRGRILNKIRHILQDGPIPVFFIFTPEIVHFAPYCISSTGNEFVKLEPVIILNAVSSEDEQWLKRIHPDRLMVRLKTSLTGNRHSVLAHGNVLNDLFSIVHKPFCIQDPDCFVTDPGFWSEVHLNQDTDMAGGPFVKNTTHHDHVLPDTFFLMFNPRIFKSLCARYKISANVPSTLIPKAQEKIRTLGYSIGQYPEQFKGYFDTLQAFWVLALSEGFQFKQMPGAGKNIFHIGGTSYLQKSCDCDLEHWDYWPLSVQYFNLSLLELPSGERFRARFHDLLECYGSSEGLLAIYPKFKDSWRYREIQDLLDYLAKF